MNPFSGVLIAGLQNHQSGLSQPQSSLYGPVYRTPWKAVALLVGGIASFVLIIAVSPSVISVPALVFGCVCFAKSLSVYNYNIGQQDFEYAMTLTEVAMKKVWLRKAIDNQNVRAKNALLMLCFNQLELLKSSSKSMLEKARHFVLIIQDTLNEKELKNEKLHDDFNQELEEFNFPPDTVQKIQACIKNGTRFTYSVEVAGIPLDII